MSFKFLGVGSPLLDILLPVDEAFLAAHVPGSKGGMEPLSSDGIDLIINSGNTKPLILPGGAAGNTVFALSQMGVDARLFGKIATDERAGIYRRFCRECQVGTDCLCVSDSGSTGCCLVLITPDAERTMRSDLGVSLELTLPELAKADFSRYDAVLTEGFMAYSRIFPELLHRIKASGSYLALDLSSFEVVKQFYCQLDDLVFKYVDLLIANQDEAEAFTGCREPEEIFAELQKRGIRDAVIKCGKNGAYLQVSGERCHVPALPVSPVVDTTAAGDLWCAGYFYGRSDNRSLEECGRLGSAFASEVIRQTGSLLPAGAIEKLKQL